MNSYYMLSVEKENKVKAQIELKEAEMEEMENQHKHFINAFNSKYKHHEFNHDIFINENLDLKAKQASILEENSRVAREKDFLQVL